MLSAPIDQKTVRQLFARPEKILGSDFLRREIAGRMREKLELVKIQPERVLDAGCGDGADLAHLQKIFAGAHVLGADASPQMLAAALQNQRVAGSSVGRLLAKWTPPALARSLRSQNEGLACADFARLPLAANAVDLVWSNLALHWHPQPDLVFAEWRRVLRTEGLLMFSCFGPDTLIELRQAFAGIDELPHTIPFVDMHDFGDMLVNAGFSTPVMDMEKITLTYDAIDKLIADVRALGGNPLLTRRTGLMGRRAWQKLCDAFDKMRSADNRVPLTFEIVYGHAFRPAPKKISSGEAIIRLDLHKKPPP
ncbi:MAG: methyltransferase domain-containing protein [Pseudomonadota bacterium]